MKTTATRAEFVALPIEQRAHYLTQRGGVKAAEVLLKDAVRADAVDDVDALRHTLHELIPASPKAALKVAKKYADQGLTKRAWRKDAHDLALRQPELGLSLVQRKKLPWDKFIGAFPSLEAARTHAEKLMDAGTVTAKDVLGVTYDANIALDWTIGGRLGVHDSMYSFYLVAPDHMQRLFDADLVTADTWLAYGNIPANVLLDHASQNKLSAVHCLKNGWVPEGAVAHWIEANEIDARTYVMLANVHWNNTRPLNKQHVEFATSFTSLPLLMDTISVMVANWNQVRTQVYPYGSQGTFAKVAVGNYYNPRPNAPVANAYARRLIAAYLQGAAN